MSEHIKIFGVKPRIQYVADGNLKKYDFPFAIFKTSDIDVYLDDKLLTSSEYEVGVEPDIEGGAISFNIAPANGTVITIARNLSIERTTDFQEGGALRAKVLNDEFDYQTACLQQVADNLNRSMVLPPYATETDVDLTLPTPSAGKAIVWNADGTNLENSTVEVNALESTLKGYKESAEIAATTATTKADIASDKADIATTKAQIATDKADEAVSTLSSKTNKDMNNLSSTGKGNVIDLLMPDYSTFSTITSNTEFTASSAGWVSYVPGTNTSTVIQVQGNPVGYISINGKTVLTPTWMPGDYGQVSTGFYPVPKGGIVYHTIDFGNVYFYPCKGS